MMKNDKMQNMNEMMSKMSESEKMKISEKIMGMCMCHDCSTMKECSMKMDSPMPSQKGLFCSMGDSNMPKSACMPKSESMKCMCTSCKIPTDMGMSMMNFPCMGKR
jgi:hypothetical protein